MNGSVNLSGIAAPSDNTIYAYARLSGVYTTKIDFGTTVVAYIKNADTGIKIDDNFAIPAEVYSILIVEDREPKI